MHDYLAEMASMMVFFTTAAAVFPFVELGTTTGAATISLPAQNDGVVNVPAGFAFGNTTQTRVYVSL